MPKFIICVDTFCEDIFDKMEDINEDMGSHMCAVMAIDKTHASEHIAQLLTSFIKDQLEEVG